MTPVLFFESVNTVLGLGAIFLMVLIVKVMVLMAFPRLVSATVHQRLRTMLIWASYLLTGMCIISPTLYQYTFAFPPCDLCWYQRIFMWPSFFILGLAIYRNEVVRLVRYVQLLSLFGVAISVYQYLIQIGYASDSAVCAPGGVSCSSTEILVFGFITIPFMAGIGYLGLIVFLEYVGRGIHPVIR